MSPKSKRELARQHLETARADLDGERYGDALNAMFHASVSRTRSDPDSVRLRAWRSDAAWETRLERDRRRATRHQSAAQQRITEALLSRARDLGAEAFALTGSTARNRRTAVSDLDYHVIGPRPSRRDLADEVDVVATDAARFWDKLRSGDDYVQWTLRHGCILLDRTGIFRAGLRAVAEERLWPDTARKRARLPAHRLHAERLIAVGDRDAAQEQMRAALTAAARAVLLDAGVFPLSRSELSDQLRGIGWSGLADALQASIHSTLSLARIARGLSVLDEAISAGAAPTVVDTRHGRISTSADSALTLG